MVLAQPKVPKLVNANGARLKRGTSKITMIGAVAESARRSQVKAQDALMAKRARLMLAARMNIYLSAELPKGKFTVVDPATMAPGEQALCPFKAKTVVLHPDDLDQAIEHFQKTKDA